MRSPARGTRRLFWSLSIARAVSRSRAGMRKRQTARGHHHRGMLFLLLVTTGPGASTSGLVSIVSRAACGTLLTEDLQCRRPEHRLRSTGPDGGLLTHSTDAVGTELGADPHGLSLPPRGYVPGRTRSMTAGQPAKVGIGWKGARASGNPIRIPLSRAHALAMTAEQTARRDELKGARASGNR